MGLGNRSPPLLEGAQMMAKAGAGHRGQSCYLAPVRIEDWPDEWQEWVALTPMERFRESEKIFAQYIALGGSLDPDPDPTSPFDNPSEWNSNAAHGRAGLRVLRRGAS